LTDGRAEACRISKGTFWGRDNLPSFVESIKLSSVIVLLSSCCFGGALLVSCSASSAASGSVGVGFASFSDCMPARALPKRAFVGWALGFGWEGAVVEDVGEKGGAEVDRADIRDASESIGSVIAGERLVAAGVADAVGI
jgi:hypothetical protein